MAAAAAQQAAKKPQGGNTQKNTQTTSKKNALHDLPRAAGIAIMALLLAAALFVGNFRALQNASPKDFIRWGDVRSIVEDRIDAAENIVSVASRVGLDANAVNAAESAMAEFEKAKTARDISRADQALTAAVSEMIAEAKGKLDSENRTMLQSAADDLAEMGSFLRQEARSFNEQAEKAEALYEKLPTKFLLAEPDVYEGL